MRKLKKNAETPMRADARKAALPLALASFISVSGPFGCSCGDREPPPSPIEENAFQVKAPQGPAPSSRPHTLCDIEFTQEEFRRTARELRKDCSSEESTVLETGGFVATQDGREMGFMRRDASGATLAFGSKGSYVVTTYVPFDTVTTLLVPPMKRGREAEKMSELNDDVLILLCPAQHQPKEGLRFISRSFWSIKCDIQEARSLEEDGQMKKLRRELDELRKKLRKIREDKEPKERKKEYEWQRPLQPGETLG